ncbi:hypothetical protein CcCBS67573_g00584 [Chytriomyces confervae]|uniref:Uncharacterized protein n=1 Tax=Chytriomyces confervae TaxID=246404 RepID=A0A507FTG6_9FUNG|nr:hypothetical protein CcCBS67573_g00584 [Chytriomyces confervae]
MFITRHQPGTKLEALDTVLFCGHEPVSQFIGKVESVFVVPALDPTQRFNNTWTHAGILVDKNVLPLECLEEGKLYLYESILCGTIMNIYEYSKILPVDHEIDPKYGFHIGPQIREWVPVIEEVLGDVAVFKLDKRERARLLHPTNIEKTRAQILEFYDGHKDWGYPLNPLPQFAAASQDLYLALTAMKTTFETFIATLSKNLPESVAAKLQLAPTREIFCSELVAKLYSDLNVLGFSEDRPPKKRFIHSSEFTPLDLEVMEALNGQCTYVKLCGKMLLDYEQDPDGSCVRSIDKELQKCAFPYLSVPNEGWAPVRNNILPLDATPSGYTPEGDPVYISRALIGKSLSVGYTTRKGIMKAGWEGAELNIAYDHEVFVIKEGVKSQYEWVKVGKLMPGFVPSLAIVAGCDEVGKPFYIARARIVEAGCFDLGALAIGRVSPKLGGARFLHQGKEIALSGEYEVLSRKVHFLERFLLYFGAQNYLVILLAILFYVMGTLRVHEHFLQWLVPGLGGVKT